MISAVVVGPTGSGKTLFAIEHLNSIKKQNVYVLNDKTTDLPKEYKHVSWEEAENLSDGSLICEDLIGCDKKQIDTLKKLLNFNLRHKNLCPILLLTHSVQNTGLQGLLSYVSHVVFTYSKNNVRSLAVTLSYYSFDKKEKEAYLKHFLGRDSSSRGYYILDVAKGKFDDMTTSFNNQEECKKKKTMPKNI